MLLIILSMSAGIRERSPSGVIACDLLCSCAGNLSPEPKEVGRSGLLCTVFWRQKPEK